MILYMVIETKTLVDMSNKKPPRSNPGGLVWCPNFKSRDIFM